MSGESTVKVEKGPDEIEIRGIKYHRCINDTCDKYIPIGEKICPFCQTNQMASND